MKRIIMALLFVLAGRALSQTPAPQKPDSSKWGWKHSVVSGLTLTQVSFKDWAQGGEDALAWTIRVDGLSKLEDTVYVWGNTYKMSYGQAKLGSETTRKTEDRLEFESVFTYKLGTEVNPYLGATLKTQFAEGVMIDGLGKTTPVSKFFDPAYLTQSAGFGYRPSSIIRTRFGAALREIVTSAYTVYANDASTPENQRVKTKIDGGVESVTDLELKLDDNLLLRSKLELFAPIKDFQQVTMRMDNTLTANVSKYVVVILNIQLINDSKASSRLQAKEVLALGLSYTLF
ncbi:MAG: DUF3078 domain-containing protein [Ignavibacteriales bacterium]|nr:DUF3078 domain-containing protein [Ignavibacteriales bacterium]